jgi:hypothetical protein
MKTARRDNVKKFHEVMTKVYKQAKREGLIPAVDINIYDKLVACPATVMPPRNGRNSGWVQPIQVHDQWRRRVARRYHRAHGQPLRGLFDFNIDWEAIYNWIMENIIPILKMLMAFLPFLI